MCGIAGYLLDEINPVAADWLTAMTQRLFHRGPDDGGAVVFGMNGTPTVERALGRPGEAVDWSFVPVKVGVGARRLSIVDLSEAGHQPMSSTDRRVWLAYNGEVYNHAALRSELCEHGMTFRGRSDTEVVLAAYRVWGGACFERLDGMWAAAIVDWSAGRMVLSRDRLGIKPLYLSRFDGGMGFASEIKSLLVLPGATGGVNEARLRDFLCDGSVDHTDETLFEGIWSLPAGCAIELDLRARGEMHAGGAVRRYWQPASDLRDADDAAEQVAQLLRESVQAHTTGDVPIGSCLSGGLDSSAIVSLVHRLRETDDAACPHLTQHTFTASLPGSQLDEAAYARSVIEACGGLESHTTQPTAERLAADMASLMWHQEQPFGSPSIYMQWEVMRAAKTAGVTVLLDGQGGDELFCGYAGFIPAYLAHLFRRGHAGSFHREYRAARTTHFKTGGLLRHVAAALLPAASRQQLRLRDFVKRRPWLDGDLFFPEPAPAMCAVLNLTPPEPLAAAHEGSALARRLWAALTSDSLPALLRFEDRNSMAFSIEARVPLLDRRLVESAMRLPVSRKIRDGRLKCVLREAIHGIVPAAVLNRTDKIGFTAPTAQWMRGGLNDWWREAVTSRSFLERGCFAPKGVLSLISRFDAGDDGAASALWRAAIVEQWARGFLDG